MRLVRGIASSIPQAKVRSKDGDASYINRLPMERWEDRESLSIEQLLDQHRFKEAVIAIERQLMNGERVEWSTIISLPQQYRQLSPFIMQHIGMKLWSEGKLLQAKEHIESAIKGFATLYMPQSLLVNLARLGQLAMRTGDSAAAQLIVAQLAAEYKRYDLLAIEERAALAHYLAISSSQLSNVLSDTSDVQEHRVKQQMTLFRVAIEAYEQLERRDEACMIMIQLTCTIGEYLEQEDWRTLLNQCVTWRMRDRDLTSYVLMLELLNAYYNKEWMVVIERYAQLELSLAEQHYWLAPSMTAYALRAGCQLARLKESNVEGYEQTLLSYLEEYPDDLNLQHEIISSLLDYYRLSNKRDDELEQRSRSLAHIVGRNKECVATVGGLITSSEAEINTSAISVERGNENNSWKLYLFGGLRFAKGQQERRQLHWKRRKARELLLYLALQPHYTAVREQILDKLQLGEPIDKANQQLYVIVHQLKRTLLTELGIQHGVIVQDGLIRLHEDTIEYVDVEHYLALTRVADQLWQFDRGLSYEMYEQAYLLYDQLLPELPYVEWLEQYREFVTQKQISLLQKCLIHAEERQDWQHAEIYLRSWLTLKPFQEEAYVKLIDLLIALDRISEAKQTYAVWEKSCREELGTAPSFKPNFK